MKKTDIKKRLHPPTVFSDEFKIKIITEYLETDLTKREILDKYGIRVQLTYSKMDA
jgi:transposase-like protein